MYTGGAMKLDSKLLKSRIEELGYKVKRSNIQTLMEKEPELFKMNMGIKGMTCNHCANSVKRALEEVPGVVFVEVNLKENTAEVSVDRKIDTQQLRKAVVGLGYEVENIEV